MIAIINIGIYNMDIDTRKQWFKIAMCNKKQSMLQLSNDVTQKKV